MKKRFTHNGKQITDHLMIEHNMENHTTDNLDKITDLLNGQSEHVDDLQNLLNFIRTELGCDKFKQLTDKYYGRN